MKNLLYKEFRLSVHPLTYLMAALLCTEALSPGIPSFVPSIYVGICYTFVFIGINKSVTTNDLFFTCTLPINRKDVIKARLCSLAVIQIIEFSLIMILLTISSTILLPEMVAAGKTKASELFTIDMHQGLFLAGVYLITIVIYDLIYLPWFYSNGKSFVINMFVAMLAGLAFSALFTIVPNYLFKDAITIGHPKANYFLQIGFLVFAILVWIGSKFLLTRICTKNLMKLDF